MEKSSFENSADNQERAKGFLDTFLEKIGKAKSDRFSFLLIGRTGVGKSSTVNALMGKEVAKTNPSDPETMEITVYETESFGVKFNVIDTPGLCDELDEVGNDEMYINRMINEIKGFDSMWFVAFLAETRVTSEEKKAIKLISEAFSPAVWERGVIIFTNSRQVPVDEYFEKLETRTRKIREEIEKYTGKDISEKIPSVAIETKRKPLPEGKEGLGELYKNPDGQEWLGELYTTVLERISDKGALPFFMATAKRIEKEKKVKGNSVVIEAVPVYEEPKITLSADQKKRVQKKINASIIPGLATAGAGIGLAFGPVGAAVGGVVGAAVGLVAWLWD